jgi:hypothetical protein
LVAQRSLTLTLTLTLALALALALSKRRSLLWMRLLRDALSFRLR